MGRFEEALAKLRARRAAVAESALRGGHLAVATAAGRDVPPEPVTHFYGGKFLHIDIERLRPLGLMATDAEDRKVSEQYRVAKRPLLKNASATLVPRMHRGNLLLVTSALPGEGKTFTCLNLCFSLAREQDWSVVLVDGDCNKPHLSRLFDAENEPGLMDLLRDSKKDFDSVVMPTNIPNFSLVSAGKRHSDAVELLASSTMDALCTEIWSSDPKRMIVFDSPPLLLTSEAPALATQMSQIVLVVQANKTPQRAVVAALGRLDPSKAISLLLNQASKGPDDGEYGGQYYGYGD
jgi:receptor protein-tyrosine kinase